MTIFRITSKGLPGTKMGTFLNELAAGNLLGWSLSPHHGASSDYGWRRRPADMEDSFEFGEEALADGRQRGGPLAWGLGGDLR